MFYKILKNFIVIFNASDTCETHVIFTSIIFLIFYTRDTLEFCNSPVIA